MLAWSVVLFKGIEYGFKMFFVSEEVCIGCIYKQCFDAMLFNITGVGFLEPEQVIVWNGLFIGAISFANIFLKLLNGGMQINKEIRLNKLLVDNIEQFLIKMKFLVGQIYFGKKQTFGKYII